MRNKFNENFFPTMLSQYINCKLLYILKKKKNINTDARNEQETYIDA